MQQDGLPVEDCWRKVLYVMEGMMMILALLEGKQMDLNKERKERRERERERERRVSKQLMALLFI